MAKNKFEANGVFCVVSAIAVHCMIDHLHTPYYVVADKRVPIKIVQEPATYGNLFVQPNVGSSVASLQIKTPPSTFSGPAHLRYLADSCYNLTDNKYRYHFCPFNNLTQHELAYRWNAYQGVLGVWKEWEIVNNTFKSMKYTDGDSCGQSNREVQVRFQCGQNNQLKNITEPSRCQYEGIFESPDVCSEDSLLVHPSMSQEMQHRWQQLESQIHNGEITQQGYNHILEELFIEIGFIQKPKRNSSEVKEVSGSEVSAVNPSPAFTANNATVDNAGQFARLDHCNEAFEDLQKQLANINEELQALKILKDLYAKPLHD